MSAAISLRNVVKTYRRGKEAVPVLHGLNLEIPAGQFVSLMGPSGSGKTTILNLVGGLDHADTGEVIVGGEHLESLSGGQLTKWRAGHVGFIFQFYNLMPMLSAAGNVELPLLLTHLSKAERARRVEIALEIVNLKDRASHKPGEMSGGQQQRVGIARALANRPDLLIADEPTGQLDSRTAVAMMQLIAELVHQQGAAAIVSTHDPQLAAFADRGLELHDGRLVAESGHGRHRAPEPAR